MSPRSSFLIINFAALALIAGGFLYLVNRPSEVSFQQTAPATNSPAQTAAVDASLATPLEIPSPDPSPPTDAAPKKVQPTSTVIATIKTVPVQKPAAQQEPDNRVLRIQNPYPFAPVPFEAIDTIARPSLVNILCAPLRAGSFSPISGSGVIIDQRGVILTNAHVAQYVLLAQSLRVNLTCAIRTGAPATPRWSSEILYIPPVWVEEHAHEVAMAKPAGTGEHDYALLRITGSLDGVPLPTAFPYLPVDTREAIGFQGDQVLAVSYPAEFLASAAQFNTYPASSVTTIGRLITFGTKTIDVISLGGIVGAQGGSSGGAVVNAWGQLVGLLSTTSEGETTAERDLRAITLSYLSRDLALQTRFDLPTILGGDVVAQALDFNTQIAPRLIDIYLAQIEK